LALQVALLPTAGAEGERRRKQLRSVHLSGCARGGARTHAPPVTAARGGDAPPLFRLAEVFLCNSWIF